MDKQAQVKSKQRVADHGEVFTAEREVNAMLDLVKQETERIDGRFLEPACGHGNFLTEILRRKLAIVAARYGKSQTEYQRYAILAVSSVYGVDIQEDNVKECRDRLYRIFDEQYTARFGSRCRDSCREAVKHILGKNIVYGDALTLKTNTGEPIMFAEWALVSRSTFKRRDFTFREILQTSAAGQADGPQAQLRLGEPATRFIPNPVREYPATNYWNLTKHE